jgi:hypothetical protein
MEPPTSGPLHELCKKHPVVITQDYTPLEEWYSQIATTLAQTLKSVARRPDCLICIKQFTGPPALLCALRYEDGPLYPNEITALVICKSCAAKHLARGDLMEAARAALDASPTKK